MILQSLTPGDVLSNQDLHTVFKVGNSGGMRKSNATNSLVLVSNRVESLYDDQWDGNLLHYTGMGQAGDQRVDWSSNKTLATARTSGIEVHLFEVFIDQQYTYQGRVELAGEPYSAQQFDKNQHLRMVWIFPLRLLAGQPLQLPVEKTRQLLQKRVHRKHKQLSDKALCQLEQKPRAAPVTTSTVERVVYTRDLDVVLYALRRAKGFCELCDQPAPFVNREGLPFLEVHHIQYLSQQGSDSIENVAALCPNCRRRMHALEHPGDVAKLQKKAQLLLSATSPLL